MRLKVNTLLTEESTQDSSLLRNDPSHLSPQWMEFHLLMEKLDVQCSNSSVFRSNHLAEIYMLGTTIFLPMAGYAKQANITE